MKPFYVYLHCKPDGTPFYVGKGSDNRAWNLHHSYRTANKHHKHVIAKYGKENIKIEILCYTFDEAEALRLEETCIFVLKFLGYKLVNLTDGGEGISGYRHTKEAKEKVRKTNLGNKYSLGFKNGLGNKSRIGMTNTFISNFKRSETLKKFYKDNPEVRNKKSIWLKNYMSNLSPEERVFHGKAISDAKLRNHHH